MAGNLAGWQDFYFLFILWKPAAPAMPEHTNAARLGGEALAGTKQELGVCFSWVVSREGSWRHQDVIIGMEEAKGTWHRNGIN